MKKEVTERKAHRANATKTTHDSFLTTVREYFDDDDDYALEQDALKQASKEIQRDWCVSSLIEKEKRYPTDFLKQRSLPFEARYYQLLPDGTELPDDQPFEIGKGYSKYWLTRLIENKYDHIPGAIDAAQSLTELNVARLHLDKGDEVQAALHLYHAARLTKRLIVADMEAKWHAGNTRSGGGQEQDRIVKLARKWLKKLRSQTPPVSKKQCYRIISARLKDEENIIREPSSVEGWFKSDKSIT